MTYLKYLLLVLVISRNVASEDNNSKLSPVNKNINGLNEDLKTASSSYSHQYSDWGGSSPGGYGFSVTGFGTIDDRFDNSLAAKDYSYDNSPKNYGYAGYNNNYDVAGLGGNEGYGVYKGYSGNIPTGYNQNRFGPSGYGSSGYSPSGYGPNGFGPSGLASAGYGPGGYEGSRYAGNGGYGGFGGNGGLASYSGYNNPYYQGGGHLGYGYYNRKGGIGNIYSSGVTPSLVTGYRGYTRR